MSMHINRDGSKKAHRERDEEGCTPLLVAAKNGDEETLCSLLQHIAQLSVSVRYMHASHN